MKTKSLVIGIVMGIAFAACSPSVKVPEPEVAEQSRSIETPSSELFAIDSLMWRQPDSALAQLQRFVASPAADSLDVFNGHYCQLLISELLYKNDWGQSNRGELLRAVAYFDSLSFTLNDIPHARRRHCGPSFRECGTQSPNRNDNIVFLTARGHYINGVGFYEQGDVVNACAEYLKTLEVMEAHFEEKELVEHKARFFAYTYNRLGDLFSEQFMMESAITCYENALVYCKIYPTSSTGVSNTLYRIGKQYDKNNEIENASLYYGQAIENMTATDNMVYRDIVASKALCDYKTGAAAEVSLDIIKRVLSKADADNERLNRYLTIGGIYYSEGIFDSALIYLEPVFKNREVGLQDQAANYLYIVYDKQGNKELSDSLLHYVTSRKKLVGENKALVSKLEDMFKIHSNQKQKRQAEAEREESVKRVKRIIIPSAGMVLFVVVFVLILRNKKLLKKQQDKADRVLWEAEHAHEKELRQWQTEADKTLEETKKRYEEELRQLKAETEQKLEEVERKHQQWMAEAKERHEEELMMQKDRSEKEIERTKKRHVKELEAERLAYEMEQDALRLNLKERESQVIALEKTLNLQQKAAKQRRMAFLKEPICQHILNDARNQHITTRDVAHELGIALKDKDFEQLGEAVEKHYEGFNHELLSQCPSLKSGLLSLCHLHLLGLNESEIAALKNLSYSAIKKQNESLQEKLGVEENVAKYVMRMAERLCGTQNGTQGGTQTKRTIDDDLDTWIERQIKDNPKITTEELAEKSHKGVRTIKRHISKMEHIHYVGSGYSGYWEIIE
ncbi:MAG: hypothetical protein IKS53_05600 [Bacteroidales bacterium]|nr:hypothetical protein [Bacteroidales bacterium]